MSFKSQSKNPKHSENAIVLNGVTFIPASEAPDELDKEKVLKLISEMQDQLTSLKIRVLNH